MLRFVVVARWRSSAPSVLIRPPSLTRLGCVFPCSRDLYSLVISQGVDTFTSKLSRKREPVSPEVRLSVGFRQVVRRLGPKFSLSKKAPSRGMTLIPRLPFHLTLLPLVVRGALARVCRLRLVLLTWRLPRRLSFTPCVRYRLALTVRPPTALRGQAILHLSLLSVHFVLGGHSLSVSANLKTSVDGAFRPRFLHRSWPPAVARVGSAPQSTACDTPSVRRPSAFTQVCESSSSSANTPGAQVSPFRSSRCGTLNGSSPRSSLACCGGPGLLRLSFDTSAGAVATTAQLRGYPSASLPAPRHSSPHVSDSTEILALLGVST